MARNNLSVYPAHYIRKTAWTLDYDVGLVDYASVPIKFCEDSRDGMSMRVK